MFRLKLIKKPILFKLKCNFSFPPIVLANLQEKTVIPTTDKQIVTPDKNYDGLSKVTVDKIPDEYIIPTGNIEIIENGVYNVREKETANVNIPILKLGTKNITSNGTYKASDDNLDGYSEVTVETSGVNINDYFVEKMNYKMCEIRKMIKQVPSIDTSICNSFNGIFSNCYNLETIPELDASKVTSVYNAFVNSSNVVNFGGFKNLGQAYSTSQSANYREYMLVLSGCTKLTEQSLINVLNNLYDIATKGCKSQQVVLGSTNLAKLTSEEGQTALTNATAKGWTLS